LRIKRTTEAMGRETTEEREILESAKKMKERGK
jgi:hypothetical protein